MDCYFCGRELKVDDVLQKVYVLREVPDGLQRISGSDTYMEFAFVHRTCPGIVCDNSPDASYNIKSWAAVRYVQEQNEPPQKPPGHPREVTPLDPWP